MLLIRIGLMENCTLQVRIDNVPCYGKLKDFGPIVALYEDERDDWCWDFRDPVDYPDWESIVKIMRMRSESSIIQITAL